MFVCAWVRASVPVCACVRVCVCQLTLRQKGSPWEEFTYAFLHNGVWIVWTHVHTIHTIKTFTFTIYTF